MDSQLSVEERAQIETHLAKAFAFALSPDEAEPAEDQVQQLGRTALYRHYDQQGKLLYVGISLNAVARLSQHSTASEWFARLGSVQVQWLDTRDEALAAERAAINAEGPIFNRQRRTPDSMPGSLSIRLVEGLRPKAARYAVYDKSCPGLLLRVAPSGLKTWSVIYRHGDRQCRLTLGTYPAHGLPEARLWARRVRAQVDDGHDPAEVKRARRIVSSPEVRGRGASDRWPDGD